jgi:fructose-1,6-bisphosphatase I
MERPAITLPRHLFLEGRAETRGELGAVLVQMAFLGKQLAREVGRAALGGQLGYASGTSNATGDVQKKLDVKSNDLMLAALAETGLVAAVISEELDDVFLFEDAREGSLLLVADPLDGSSNTDNDGAVGTIFGIHRNPGRKPLTSASMLEVVSTNPPVAAGYILYGPSTMLVYSAGKGVHGFTLDRELGEFLLTHPNIRCPRKGKHYSANTARKMEWRAEISAFVDYLNEHDAKTKRPYSLRYAGALVADLHRALLEGGLYLYPADAAHKAGKLRQVYECAPLAFVVENAGGRALGTRGRTLDARVSGIHDKNELFIGGAADIEVLEQFLAGKTLETTEPRS